MKGGVSLERGQRGPENMKSGGGGFTILALIDEWAMMIEGTQSWHSAMTSDWQR